jgi:hypothetical protein
MTTRVLFIHGIAQGGKDPAELKQTWIDTLEEGLAAAGKDLPASVSFDFPFYGDKLDELVAAAEMPTPDDVAAKGPGEDKHFERFMQSALTEMYESSDELTQELVEAELDPNQAREKGPQNWWWVRAITRVIDNRYPGTAESAIGRFLKDVYLYVNAPGVTNEINAIVEGHLTSEPTLVVGHSLGSVVGYKVIQNQHRNMGRSKYVTIGSPLGIKAISSRLGIPENSTDDGWYNAYDPQDIVALNPLDDEHFPTYPPIANSGGVSNQTANQHGISGYLNDPDVAAVIADTLHGWSA